MWTGPKMHVQKLTVSEYPGPTRKKTKKNRSCCWGAHIQFRVRTRKSRQAARAWHLLSTYHVQSLGFLPAFNFYNMATVLRPHKWRHWIPDRLDPTPDCPKPISPPHFITLTSLSIGENIFTPISNQVKVLAPFKFQLKMQALPVNYPPHLFTLPSGHLDSDPSRTLEPSNWGGTVHSCSLQTFLFEEVLFVYWFQDLFIYLDIFWGTPSLWIAIYLRSFLTYRSF